MVPNLGQSIPVRLINMLNHYQESQIDLLYQSLGYENCQHNCQFLKHYQHYAPIIRVNSSLECELIKEQIVRGDTLYYSGSIIIQL